VVPDPAPSHMPLPATMTALDLIRLIAMDSSADWVNRIVIASPIPPRAMSRLASSS